MAVRDISLGRSATRKIGVGRRKINVDSGGGGGSGCGSEISVHGV